MRIAILHFQPLEGYPPTINLLNFFSGKVMERIWCLTNFGNFNYRYTNDKIKIKRLGKIGLSLTKYQRIITYLKYNIGSLMFFLTHKPSVIVCYETFSTWPAYIYTRYINHQVRVFIHYHEYSTPQEYQTGMWMVRYFHECELKIYHQVEWISHTNSHRLEMFRDDISFLNVDSSKFRIMHNYPPAKWGNQANATKKSQGIRLVYVGYSLSFKTMYAKELFAWIKSVEIDVSLDCFLHIIPEEVSNYINENQLHSIHLHPSVKYDELPMILKNYHIGLILYNGAIENYIYNETNKLFEYLVCGLDVWLPKVMKGSLPHACTNARPRVLAKDFERLDQYNVSDLVGDLSLPQRKINYTCESEYEKIFTAILNEG